MYDPLWENHPKIKQIRAESKAKGEIKALRTAVVTIVRTRFPDLAELAQQKSAQISKPEILNYLIEQITVEPDEAGVRALLRPTTA